MWSGEHWWDDRVNSRKKEHILGDSWFFGWAGGCDRQEERGDSWELILFNGCYVKKRWLFDEYWSILNMVGLS